MEYFRWEAPIPRSREQGSGEEVIVDERTGEMRGHHRPPQRVQRHGEERRERSMNSKEHRR